MLVILSPAKTLDFESDLPTMSASQPLFQDESAFLVNKLKRISAKRLQTMYNANSEITALNKARFQEWSLPFHAGNSRQAMLAFTGEVYRGLNAQTMTETEFEFAQQHMCILSGLYGILRPLDLIQPYRLEMGTRWEVSAKIKNLYAYWSDIVTEWLNNHEDQGPLINLASNEYFKAVDQKKLNREVITCHFRDLKGSEYKSLMTYAKHARGAMTRFIVRNHLTDPEELKAFDGMGYSFNPRLSSGNELVFTRDQVVNS